ncbi:MAG TPA: LD-carboxypeptidase [Vicinamibacterales bacterium]|nr:LD-carboxypeptidase [Vicinamibacterales bacterium]
MIAKASAAWLKPRRLKSGDRLALIAPASPFQRDEFDAGVVELQRLGFEAVFDDRVFARQRFVAGDAVMRAAALHDAWKDRTVAGIIAVRGGYGSAQMLPLLDAALMRKARKVLVGYSDVTALLWYQLQHGLVGFHGPMVERRLSAGETAYHRDSFIRAVTVAAPLGPLAPPALEVMRRGEAQGPLLGGTLTQLTASLGTPWAFDPPAGAILFIEDIGERPYRVDRMLTQLAQAGILSRASALVFGEMPSCDEPGGEHAIRDVLSDFVKNFSGPVLFGFPSGHTSGTTWTLPFGVRARVVTTPAPVLVIEEAAVE